MVLLIVASISGCAKHTNNNLSTKIQELGDNPTKAEIDTYAKNKLKGTGLSDKEIDEFTTIIKNINHGLPEALSQLSPEEQKELALSFVKDSDRKDFEQMLSEYKPPSVEENFANIQKGNITIDNAGYFMNQCTSAVEGNNFDKAIKVCSSYLEKFPQNFNILEARAIAYYRKEMINEALADTTKIKEILPTKSKGYWMSAMCLQALEKYEDAIQNCKLALKFEKDAGEVCDINHLVGELYDQLGDVSNAKKYFAAEEQLRANLKSS